VTDGPGVVADVEGGRRRRAFLDERRRSSEERYDTPGSQPMVPDDVALVAGEDLDGVGYHYYPERVTVLGWIGGAGLAVVEEAVVGEYWHILARRTEQGSDAMAPPARG
jgi:hypothetical protein